MFVITGCSDSKSSADETHDSSTNEESSSTDSYDTDTSSSDEDSSISEDDSTAKESPSDENPAADNTVYGKLTNKESLTEENDTLYKDERNNIMYSIVENDVIFQVSIGLGDNSTFEIAKDKSHLLELAMDYMNDDATLTQTKSNESYIYQSSSLGKKYMVDFTLNNEGYVIEILLTQFVQ